MWGFIIIALIIGLGTNTLLTEKCEKEVADNISGSMAECRAWYRTEKWDKY